MNGHLYGTRPEHERDAWLQRREDWKRNNPAPDNPEK